jgi:hypothetical protein
LYLLLLAAAEARMSLPVPVVQSPRPLSQAVVEVHAKQAFARKFLCTSHTGSFRGIACPNHCIAHTKSVSAALHEL